MSTEYKEIKNLLKFGALFPNFNSPVTFESSILTLEEISKIEDPNIRSQKLALYEERKAIQEALSKPIYKNVGVESLEHAFKNDAAKAGLSKSLTTSFQDGTLSSSTLTYRVKTDGISFPLIGRSNSYY